MNTVDLNRHMGTTDENVRSLFTERFGCPPQAVAPLLASGSGRRYFRMTGPEMGKGGADPNGRRSPSVFEDSGGPLVSGVSSVSDGGSVTEASGRVPSEAVSAEGRTCIGVIGDNAAENAAFIYLADHFRSRGINVPEVYAVSADGRCYLQQDLGSLSLFDAVSEGRARAQAAFSQRISNASVHAPDAAARIGDGLSLSGDPGILHGNGDSSVSGDPLVHCVNDSPSVPGGSGVHRIGEGSSVSGCSGVSASRNDSGLPGDGYSAREEELLCKTIARLPEIQFRGADGLDFSRCFPVPAMSERSIMFDLNYFKYCYLLASGIEFDEARLQDEFEKLAADLLAEPYDTFMYRDFQTRNVMMVGGEPWFIDFQGGRSGPIYYDVASFVWQARSCFPPQLRRKMISAYLDALQEFRPTGREDFLSRLRLFLLFRTMQVLGAYGFRGLYQRKSHFIESIPYALANLRDLLAEPFRAYPYLSSLLSALTLAGLSTPALAGLSTPALAGLSNPILAPTGPSSFASLTSAGRLTVKVTSFSYKAGIPEDDSGNGGGYVFDCRGLSNPGRYAQYRHSTGRDLDVIEFIEADGGVFDFLKGVYAMVDPHVEMFIRRGFTSLCVNFGCTGGQHRSVYCAEALTRHLARKFPEIDILLTHTRLGIERRVIRSGDTLRQDI